MKRFEKLSWSILFSFLMLLVPGPGEAQSGPGGSQLGQKDARKMMEEFRRQFREQNKRMNDLIMDFFEDRRGSFNKGLQQKGLQGLNFESSLGGVSETRITKKEEPGHVIYELDASNIDPNALEVNVEDGMVTIRGQTRKESSNKEKDQFGQATSISTFSRSFPLPSSVEPSSLKIERKEKKIQIKFKKRRV